MGFKFDPDAFYDEPSLRRKLNISLKGFRDGRKSGQLNPTRRGNRFIYRGDEIIAWLSGDMSESNATVC